jgi:beta-mannanase
MNTSRINGTLVLHTDKPYKMAKSGINSDATEIICKEITYAVENVANDMEQMVLSAVTDWAIKNRSINGTSDSSGANEQMKANEDFNSNESPTEAQVNEQAKSLETTFKMQTGVKITELSIAFEQFINNHLILAEGGVEMSSKHPIWISIDRKDKLKIMFSYLCFFIQPLSSQVKLPQTATVTSNVSGATGE